MACRITELVLDCRDPERLAGFWCEVLGWKVPDGPANAPIERARAGGPAGPPRVVGVRPTPDPKRDKLRLHLDVNATDRDQAAELERLLALGARPADVGQTGAESWHVLADPEGNEFCLLRRRVAPVG